MLPYGNVLRPGYPVTHGTRAARTVAGATRLAEGSVRARGEVETHTSPFALPGSLPHQQSLAGRPVKRRFEALDHTLAVPTAGGAAGGLVPARLAGQPFRSNTVGRSVRSCITLASTFRFRTRAAVGRRRAGSSSTGGFEHATRKRLLLGPALLPAQVEARASSTDGGEVSPTAGASPTFGRRYGARFILHLWKASDGTLTLFQMLRPVPSARPCGRWRPRCSAGTYRRSDGPLVFPHGIDGPGSDPPGRAAWACPMPVLPDADLGIPKGWVACLFHS